MITIVDYGMGNLGSLLNMFKRIDVKAIIQSDPKKIRLAEKIVLPGVGAFDAAMHRIDTIPSMREVLDLKANEEKIPILGVCLGMQLFMDSSEEGELGGLGWIPGKATRFPNNLGLKIPHMGWNIAMSRKESKNPLTRDLEDEPRYYFVHSYRVIAKNRMHSIMQTFYGTEFDSALNKENIYGVQFHPEKSHRYGMTIIKNFSNI
jgi:glutamine amidotransferase